MHSENTTAVCSAPAGAASTRAEGASTAIGKASPPVREKPKSCGASGFGTNVCRAAPAEHPSKKVPFGCGKYACPDPICVKKWERRRMKLVWIARFAHFHSALLHITATVPGNVWALVVDVKKFRAAARRVVEAWMREHFGVEPQEKLFILDVFHPAGGDLAVWKPHANIFLPACVFTADGKLRDIRGLSPLLSSVKSRAARRALADLSARWATAVAKLLGVPVPVARTNLSLHTRPEARSFVLRRELRSFPGWSTRGLSDIRWAGVFGIRVWGKVRDGLGFVPNAKGPVRCAAGHVHRPGEICGAPLVPFPTLPDDGRAQVLAAEDRTGDSIVEDWEREFHLHTATQPRCDCSSCRRGRSNRAPGRAAFAKTRRAAQYAMEIATAKQSEAAVAPGGVLHDAVEEVWAASRELPPLAPDGLTVEDAMKLRLPFEQFIARADEAGVTDHAELPWPKRLKALLAERAARDAEAQERTGDWQFTVNLALADVQDGDVTDRYPSLRDGRGSEQAP